MSTILSLGNWRPPARYPPLTDPWTAVEIHQAPALDGTYTLLQTITFADPDTDPTDPKIRNFSVTGVIVGAWLKIRWKDAAANTTSFSDPQKAPEGLPVTGATFVPTVVQVAALIIYRTVGSASPGVGLGGDGGETGTFSTTTRPTAAQVTTLAAIAAQDLAADLAVDVPADFVEAARRVAAVRCALLIESSFYPESGSERGSIARLLKQYEAGVAQLQEAIRGGVRIF
jgi:hypothetical protein